MAPTSSPLVSVVIPVHNGAEIIGGAIRSVLAQTYENFELTIVDNCSTDGTPLVAEGLARNDARVGVYRATEFVPAVESFNRAFSLISDCAEYCKILGADDWLAPNCLAELVALAEEHPSIGMVTSYFLLGSRVNAGPPFPRRFFSGREICRRRLLGDVKAFGAPSASLIRASFVREKRPFYDPLRFHCDIDAYLDVLQRSDFGFVHQILSYVSQGEKSPTSNAVVQLGGSTAAAVDEIERWGPVYLTADEQRARRRAVWHEYYTLLARNVFEFGMRKFWRFHRKFQQDLGYRIDYGRLSLHVLARIADVALNPYRTVKNVASRLARPAEGQGEAARFATTPTPRRTPGEAPSPVLTRAGT